jgi:hypothetical protein
VNLSKSEGVWGNTETTSYNTERYRGQQQLHEREPRTGGETVKSRHISAPLPSQAPPQKTNYLFLFINLIDSYGFGNRKAKNHSVSRQLGEVCTLPPQVPASITIHHINIFQKFGDLNV